MAQPEVALSVNVMAEISDLAGPGGAGLESQLLRRLR